MSPTRLYIDQELRTDTDLDLRGDKARYVGRVLRLQVEDELVVFNGLGGEYRAVIRSISKHTVGLSLRGHLDIDLESPLSIHLLQGISSGERMDMVMQKATELGVTRITPLITEQSMVRLDAKRASKRTTHWRGIVASASEQCGRNCLPSVDEPIPFRSWLGENMDSPGCRLIFRPGATKSLRSIDKGTTMMTLLIGPEGGFSNIEYELAEESDFGAVNLGPRILRTETAAVAALAALQVLMGDLS